MSIDLIKGTKALGVVESRAEAGEEEARHGRVWAQIITSACVVIVHINGSLGATELDGTCRTLSADDQERVVEVNAVTVRDHRVAGA